MTRSDIVSLHAVHQGDTDVSSGHPKWWFLSKVDAQNTAKCRGWYGSEAPMTSYRAVMIDDEYWPLMYNAPVILGGPNDDKYKKAIALAKLTEEDKRVLGLS